MDWKEKHLYVKVDRQDVGQGELTVLRLNELSQRFEELGNAEKIVEDLRQLIFLNAVTNAEHQQQETIETKRTPYNFLSQAANNPMFTSQYGISNEFSL